MHIHQHKTQHPATRAAANRDIAQRKSPLEEEEPLQGKFEQPVQRQPNRTGLPDSLKSGLENTSGMNMDDIRVHYNSAKPSQLQAHAHTQGTDIHVAPGQEQHLAHEAWHVVQQKQGRVQPTLTLAGQSVNDNAVVKREADTLRLKTALPAWEADKALNLNSAPAAPIQRRLIIHHINGKKIYSGGQKGPKEWINTDSKREMFDYMACSKNDYVFHKLTDFEDAVKKAEKRKKWWRKPGKTHVVVRVLDPQDPKFTEIEQEILRNTEQSPYSTDALHEGGALMSSYMKGNKFDTAKELFSSKAWMGQQEDSRPKITITRIEMIKNQALKNAYDTAKLDIKGRNGGQANEQNLYSGHSVQGMDYITKHGHDPSYGSYDPPHWYGGKGHGAHGRGAYFSDRVDKAASYSSVGQTGQEERSFFRQKVLLGKSLEYKDRGRFRYKHHNEMVRSGRSPLNKTVINGEAEDNGTNMSQYDSLVGKRSYESGSGLMGTLWHKNQFDSNEYMVRNADQVLPKYRIYYKIE